MGLLTSGLGRIQALHAGGLGTRLPQTAHPDLCNTPVVDPDLFLARTRDDNGDLEYPVATLAPRGKYNSRNLSIYLPQDLQLPRSTISRLNLALRRLKIMTQQISVRGTVTQVLHLELQDPVEE